LGVLFRGDRERVRACSTLAPAVPVLLCKSSREVTWALVFIIRRTGYANSQ